MNSNPPQTFRQAVKAVKDVQYPFFCFVFSISRDPENVVLHVQLCGKRLRAYQPGTHRFPFPKDLSLSNLRDFAKTTLGRKIGTFFRALAGMRPRESRDTFFILFFDF